MTSKVMSFMIEKVSGPYSMRPQAVATSGVPFIDLGFYVPRKPRPAQGPRPGAGPRVPGLGPGPGSPAWDRAQGPRPGTGPGSGPRLPGLGPGPQQVGR